jgi:hypothetical protein
LDAGGIGVELEVKLRQGFVGRLAHNGSEVQVREVVFVGRLAHNGSEVWVREVVDEVVDCGRYHDVGAW